MSAFLRALHLRALHRDKEAVACFVEHLAAYPQDCEAHAQLALTRADMPGERRRALESIDAAIAIDSDCPAYFAYRAMILTRLDRHDEALAAALSAIGLDPELAAGWLAKAQALGGKQRWAEAEEAARQALKLDPDSRTAQNLLSQFQRLQGKLDAANRGAGERLARDPEDPIAHANAGWAALQRREVAKAEEHFREALRLSPGLEYARLGLRESFKARSGFYRLFLRWMFFLQRFSHRQRVFIVIGILVAVQFGGAIAKLVHPAALALLVVAYLVFAFSGYLASGLAHFLMLKDRNARMSLTRAEKLDGLCVGGGFVAGIVLLALGCTVWTTGAAMLGGALVLGAIPGSMVFDNDSRPGRLVFGSFLAFIYLAGATSLAQDLRVGDPFAAPAETMIGLGLLLAVGSSWLAMVPSLRQGTEE